jgi:hypothetical protein
MIKNKVTTIIIISKYHNVISQDKEQIIKNSISCSTNSQINTLNLRQT